MSAFRVDALYSYPVKSMQACELTEMAVGTCGPVNDRRFMVVDKDGRMMSQRTNPLLARITPSIDGDGLTLRNNGVGGTHWPMVVPFKQWENGPVFPLPVQVHKDTMTDVIDQGDEVADWISRCISASVRLVCMPHAARRPSHRLLDGETSNLAFADGYPFLLTARGSLHALNRQLHKAGEASVPMANFRPNIVVDGGYDFEEESLIEFEINGIRFKGVKPCDRCAIITTDQVTGVRRFKEPTRTLTRFHSNEMGNPIFGMNLNHFGEGIIRVGDKVTVLRQGDRPPA